METVAFAGFENCVRLRHGSVEMIATRDVGPRVLFFGPSGGENMLAVYERDRGVSGDGRYHSYGGHRLWRAPEDRATTYTPDSGPTEWRAIGNGIEIASATDEFGIRKSITLSAGSDGGFRLSHRLENRSDVTVQLAPWAITVMAPGGECLIPQPERQNHSDKLLPVRPVVLWAYTSMSDERLTWGSRVIRMRQAELPPTKLGSLIDQGIAVYSKGQDCFVKRFPHVRGATYPDFGCNFEAFTRPDMLEVESLGPLVDLAAGESASHVERWYFLKGEAAPADDEAAGDWLAELAVRCPL